MNKLLSALGSINCAELDYMTWVQVGMALKAEGMDVSVWDEWSRSDPKRYHHGECQRRWDSFGGSATPVTGATIYKLARDNGWSPFTGEAGIMDWNDVITYDGSGSDPGDEAEQSPTDDLILYLQTLFAPEDYVGYVTNDAWQNDDGKWVPAKGVYTRTAGELIESLHRHPDDLGATVGDWKPEAGAWIRFNALDGNGVKNENVTKFRFALVESDAMSIADQISMYRKLELPVAALVSSAGKSVHAIVRVDAADVREYRKRVDFLYDFLANHGVKVDTQNRNPSRLSRMPGATRNGQIQKLLGVNIGRKSWVDWMDFVEGATDELPGFSTLEDSMADPLPLPEEIIQGVLRRGHKMLISGSSKAGKSFLLMELCIALAEGKPWLGFPCKKSRVLYVNLEIDPASCINRFAKIYAALGYGQRHMADIIVWNLRGHAVPLDQLVPKLIRRVRDQHLDAIIIDPIYKVITGDENSASEMAAFCNQFDRICNETGCSTIYCHHHSKGAQGAKRAMDRASGSGVFARDPDAQLDMIELELSDELRLLASEKGMTGWRVESSLREFPDFKPVDFWFRYPIHILDTDAALETMPAQGTAAAGRLRNKHSKSTEQAEDEFRKAFDAQVCGGSVSIQDMMSFLGVSDKTVYARLKKMNGEFALKKGRLYRGDHPAIMGIEADEE
ncbi:MAG: AAA family ATPase [Oscillospiraceae bacterium]|nr:AAA family ATPase [Oscillospiraceae bacterium]